MRNLLVSIVFLFFYFIGFSQSYAYSFEGNLSSIQQEELIQEVKKNQVIQSCELRYKLDSQRGEIFFSIEKPIIEGENDLFFSPVEIKEIFLRFELIPIDFRQLK